jgi:hypothetical protein
MVDVTIESEACWLMNQLHHVEQMENGSKSVSTKDESSPRQFRSPHMITSSPDDVDRLLSRSENSSRNNCEAAAGSGFLYRLAMTTLDDLPDFTLKTWQSKVVGDDVDCSR